MRDAVGQRLTVNQFQHQRQTPVRLFDPMKGGDIRVIQRGEKGWCRSHRINTRHDCKALFTPMSPVMFDATLRPSKSAANRLTIDGRL